MNFTENLFATGWYLAAYVPLAALIVWAARGAPWSWLKDSRHLNVLLGAVVFLCLLWSMKAGVKPGLSLHYVGASLLTLVAGPQFAVLGLLMVLAVVTLNGDAAWIAFGLNAMVMVAVPVFVASRCLRLVERWLPHHLFVYIFLNAFFGAGLTVLGVGGVSTGTLLLGGAYGASFLFNEFTLFFLLLAFSEAWLTGMAITVMVVYRPEWVSTFDDARYLKNK